MIAKQGKALYLSGTEIDQNRFLTQITPSFEEKALQFIHLKAESDNAKPNPSYGIWQRIFWHLIDIPENTSVPDQVDHVLQWVEANPLLSTMQITFGNMTTCGADQG